MTGNDKSKSHKNKSKNQSAQPAQTMNNGRQRINSQCLFVCVDILRPSQPNGVMTSAVSLPNHTFTGQA